MDGFMQRFLSPIWYWRIPLIGQHLDGRGSSIFRVNKLVNNVVDEAEVAGDSERRSFLQKVLSLMKSEKVTLGRDRVVGNVLGLFLAGTDTTSKTLTTALYLLAKDQELQHELREEARTIDLDQLALQDLHAAMPRLKSFLHEVHRMYGVPVIGLTSTQDIPFRGGTIPRHTNIIVMTLYIPSSPTSPSQDVPLGPQGEAPHVFCARRYLTVNPQDGSVTSVSPITTRGGFMGFGFGVRTCPGRLYSEALSYVALCSLLQTFTWTLGDDHPDATFIMEVVMRPDCDVRLNMTTIK
jgi:cytochrome P450